MSKISGKYLTFTLQGESYGLNVLVVREIIRPINITSVPQLPEHVRGVINLRGKVIPVMDLRLRMGWQKITDTEQTCIVVAQIQSSAQKAVSLGLIVDGVEEVVNLSAAEIQDPPAFGGATGGNCIVGVVTIKNRVKMLLDIEKLFAASALPALSH